MFLLEIVVGSEKNRLFVCWAVACRVALKRAGFNAEGAQKWRPLAFTHARSRTCHCVVDDVLKQT